MTRVAATLLCIFSLMLTTQVKADAVVQVTVRSADNKPVDGSVQKPGSRIEGYPPDLLEQLLPSDHVPSTIYENPQEIHLTRCESGLMVTYAQRTTTNVQLERPKGE